MNNIFRKITACTLVGAIVAGSFGGYSQVNAKETYAGENNSDEILYGTTITESSDTYIVMAEDSETQEYIVDTYAESTENISGEYEYIPEEDYEIVHLEDDDIQEIQETCDDVIIEKDSIVKASGIKRATKKEKRHSSKINSQKLKKKEYNDKKHKDWNKKIVNADDYKEDIQTEKKVKVAIIDSGINFDVRFDVKESINLVPGEEEVTPLFMDTSGHGMSVASVITGVNEDGSNIGINENVELYSARVLDDDGNAPISRVIEAIYWAIEKDVDIINMSFGTQEYSAALEKAVTDAENAGILIVAAAGNDETVEYPAAYGEVIAVGSVNSECEISDFSATGEEIELVAPGETIKVADAFNTETAVSGTSVAAPHVTAIASILMQNDSEATNDLVREVLNKSANSLGEHNEYGNGIVDMEYALEIYEDVKENYESNEVVNVIETNESVIEVYDSGEVKRSWSQAQHEDMAKSAGAINNKYILCGAKAPDDMSNDKYEGLSLYPELHGGGHGSNAYNAINYVASYCCIIRMANYLYSQERNGNRVSKQLLKNLLLSESYGNALAKYTNVKQGNRKASLVLIDVIYDLWNGEIEKEMATSVNIYGKKAFLYGVAMHVISDAYAHSAFAFVDNKWTKLTHPTNGNGLADLKTYGSNRFRVAYGAVQNVWTRFNYGNENSGIYNDYYNSNYDSYYVASKNINGFKLKKIYDYAIESGATNTSVLNVYFRINK